MRLTKRTALISCAILLIPIAAAAQAQKRAMTFDDLAAMHRLSDPQTSPDGKWVAYTVATPDKEANRMVRNIWLVATAGGEPRQLTRGGSDTRARWSPDGARIAFLSVRDGAQQVYLISLAGGDAIRFTTLSTEADNQLWSPDGKWIAFVSRAYPDCRDDACNQTRDEEKAKSKVKARIYEKLLFRHWTEWWDGKRSHLFVQGVSGGAARDLTPGANYDVPPFTLGAPEAIAFSPDSQELCFTADTQPDEATSTNDDLFTVPVNGASAPARITTNPGSDWGPAYSPDGKWIAYRAQFINGYESDRFRLMLYDRAAHRHSNLTETFDRWIDTYAWAPDSKTIFFNAEDRAEEPIYALAPAPGATPQMIVRDGFNPEFGVTGDGKTLVFARTSLTMPAELFAANSDGSNVRQLTHQNAARLAELDLSPGETFWFAGADGTQVEGILVKPPHFDASKQYPMLLLVHGGPQGAWDDAWGYRWNPEMFVTPGYVAVMINPRGSTGYGQKFTADISGDWGGRVFVDLMKGVDYAISKYPFIDGTRLAAAGGSYGGFMIDWMESQAKGRFKCLISHAGPYDAVSMYATEELWFEEWEYKGTPWTNPSLYQTMNPSHYAADFAKYKTPTLVFGGELDFRVPYTQDLEFFTVLQRQGVPSKMVIFPDEGHWVLKPQNSELWYKTFLDWLGKYL